MFVGGIAEQPVAKTADREVADCRKRLFIVSVDDQPGDFIGLVGNQYFLQEVGERDIRQRHLRGHPLAIVECRDTRQKVPGARRTGLGHDFLQIVEAVDLGADGMGKTCHFCLRFK
ncbi:hypothetical protein D3C86_1658610 [compost metagenome]